MAGAAAIVMIQAQGRVIGRFEGAGAGSPATAIAFDAQGRRDVQRMFDGLVRAGAIVEAGPGRYYLDRDGLARYRARSRKQVLGVLGVLTAAVLGLLALG